MPMKPVYWREPRVVVLLDVLMEPSSLNTMPLMVRLLILWPRPSMLPENFHDVVDVRWKLVTAPMPRKVVSCCISTSAVKAK